MSVEALAAAWARTEHAPDGSVVVADSEIAGRLRGGTPWRHGGDDALLMAMVIRPAIDPLQEALLWLVASLGAADALDSVTDTAHMVQWPDTIVPEGQDGGDPAQCVVNVTTQLGPGRVEHSVLAVRTHLGGFEIAHDPENTKARLLDALSQQLQAATRLLERDPLALLEAFNDRCVHMHRRVLVSLLPRGEARGRATAVDKDGFLVLESSTGMLERIAPASLRSIEHVD